MVQAGPASRMSWADFLAAHWEQIAADGFFTVELMTLRGLVRYSVLFVIRLSTRRVDLQLDFAAVFGHHGHL